MVETYSNKQNAKDQTTSRGKPYHMECVIHYGKDSDRYFQEFERKRAALLRDDLSDLSEEELKEIYEMLEKLKKDG